MVFFMGILQYKSCQDQDFWYVLLKPKDYDVWGFQMHAMNLFALSIK